MNRFGISKSPTCESCDARCSAALSWKIWLMAWSQAGNFSVFVMSFRLVGLKKTLFWKTMSRGQNDNHPPKWMFQQSSIHISYVFVLVAGSSSPYPLLNKRNIPAQPGEVPQQAEVEKAAEAASADDFIQKLEEKYQSMIGRWAGCWNLLL